MSQENEEQSLAARVARLEAEMAVLRTRLGLESPVSIQETRPSLPGKAVRIPAFPVEQAAAAEAPVLSSPAHSSASDIVRGENWFKWSGIALVLFGLAFLFKYSIDRGWLVPTVR
ncbi:DUF2339 domain-containing protein, partial [bacterium]|nr:DUF2339 domain-containing protein [bacterium]